MIYPFVRRKEIRLIKKGLNKNPTVLNDLIFEYMGSKDTIACPLCFNITDSDSWLVKNYGKEDEELYCPLCFTVCCDSDCHNDFILNENIITIECNNWDNGDEEKPLCKKCFDRTTFKCDGCDDFHCSCDYCEKRDCHECDKSYCDGCECDGYLYWCAECEGMFCCKKFYKVADNQLNCKECIGNPILPEGMIRNF